MDHQGVDEDETRSVSPPVEDASHQEPAPSLHLVILWSQHELNRVGECSALKGQVLLGRRSEVANSDSPVLEFSRVRPGEITSTGALLAPTLSRRQWLLKARESTVDVENVGKHPLVHNGITVSSVKEAKAGDTLGVQGVVLFLLSSRPRALLGSRIKAHEFGAADADGLVGETPEMWRLRRLLSDVAAREAHALLLGDSGCGKELAARALHRNSPRASSKFLARNAATIPEGLIEAELFGNAPNYPNPGMASRHGLFGLADGGVLFLDEIAELAERQQANLLRVLDAGEYQRLGEDKARKTHVRVLAATNRPAEALKHDVLARFAHRVRLPSLGERRADIPLLVRHLLAAERHHSQKGPWLPSQSLVDALVRHEYQTNMRELERLLLLAMEDSTWPSLELTRSVESELRFPESKSSVEPSREDLVRALSETTSASDAAKRLGLPSRFALYRLMKKQGVQNGEKDD